ncbi:unnamed protein product [Calicophoron daubneyi]|uniref:Uncharacterized protein n=1 Tax=Calicophoron daubneyi TaxID=300641 RepID=A0AAV2TNP6_CALDB
MAGKSQKSSLTIAIRPDISRAGASSSDVRRSHGLEVKRPFCIWLAHPKQQVPPNEFETMEVTHLPLALSWIAGSPQGYLSGERNLSSHAPPSKLPKKGDDSGNLWFFLSASPQSGLELSVPPFLAYIQPDEVDSGVRGQAGTGQQKAIKSERSLVSITSDLGIYGSAV